MPDRSNETGSAPATEVSEVGEEFSAQFGRPPEGVWRAPGRVNLIGDHTDYSGGFAMPFAIERHVTLAAARRRDGQLRLVSIRCGSRALRMAEIAPGRISGWPAYPAGALWALAQAGVVVPGLDLLIAGDLPIGVGLSSSAAVGCATLLAAADLCGGPRNPVALARLAQVGENEIAGVPSGPLDQIASFAARAGHVLLLDSRSLAHEAIAFAPERQGLGLLVIDTRIRRSLSGGPYAKRRRACEEAARALGVGALRELSENDLARARRRLDATIWQRVRHVIRENALVLEAAALLRAGRISDIGPLLTASHRSLDRDYEVTVPELNLAAAAAGAAGALGARMTGAGFGGCAIALVPVAERERIAGSVTRAFADRGWRAPGFVDGWPAAGAARMG